MIPFKNNSYSRWGDAHTSNSLVRGLHLDIPLLLGLFILSIIGLAILYSASGQDTEMITRQLIRFCFAFTIMLILAQVPPYYVEYWAPWFYGAGLLLLVAVLLFGEVGKGAQRWLDLGLFRFQPSEIMKLAVPIMVAWYLADNPLPPSKKHLFYATLLIIVPVLFIAKQPDLGTALLVASSGVFVLLLSGVRWKHVTVVLLCLAVSAPLLWYNLHDYQKARIITLLDPENDPLGTGYHIIQSKIAIGSGGLYGKGWMNGSQSHLKFLPERSTDFIFAVFGEEFGFIGILFILALYLFVIVRGLYIATQAQDTFARLLAGGLILTFFVYIFVNIGMVAGLLPVVGVPLPLVSYGGTSMVTVLAAFGVLMSIHTHRKLLPT